MIVRMKLALKKFVVWAQRLVCAQDTITSLSLQQSKYLNYCKYLHVFNIGSNDEMCLTQTVSEVWIVSGK